MPYELNKNIILVASCLKCKKPLRPKTEVKKTFYDKTTITRCITAYIEHKCYLCGTLIQQDKFFVQELTDREVKRAVLNNPELARDYKQPNPQKAAPTKNRFITFLKKRQEKGNVFFTKKDLDKECRGMNSSYLYGAEAFGIIVSTPMIEFPWKKCYQILWDFDKGDPCFTTSPKAIKRIKERTCDVR